MIQKFKSSHYDFRTVVYGSFNPITNGHTDFVEQLSNCLTSRSSDWHFHWGPKTDLADRIALCKTVLAEHGKGRGKGFNTSWWTMPLRRALHSFFESKDVTDFDYEYQWLR